jgi:hypothetical protein
MPGRPRITYRQCPGCAVVRQASAFRRAQGPTNAPAQLQNRRCPECGHVGPLLGFPIAERPTQEEAP